MHTSIDPFTGRWYSKIVKEKELQKEKEDD